MSGASTEGALEEFTRTSVAFALWQSPIRVERVFVRLEVDGPRFARCGISAHTEAGRISAGATGANASEAIREAALLLEPAVFDHRRAARPGPPARIAA